VLADVASSDPGWGCVQLTGVDPTLPSYPIELVARADPGPSTEQYYVESALSVQGQGTQKSLQRSVFLEGRPLDQALLTGMESQVRDLASAFEPCQAKAEMHGSLNWAQSSISYTFALEVKST
jgi:hypothetical protein